MKTKIVTMYVCDVCGSESTRSTVIKKCEQRHKDIDAWLEKQTEWGRSFVKEAGMSVYKEALELLEDSYNRVAIQQTDELGKLIYAIFPVEDITFWLGTFETKEDAEKLCKEMGWEYER